jgi:hypothetical protein
VRSTLERPPAHVCATFGGPADGSERLPDSTAWRCGDLVLKPVTDKVRTLWTAHALDYVREPGLRVGKPVRSTDGRWIVGGWTASRFVPGTPEHRGDASVLAAVKLHRATAGLPRPDFLDARTDVDAVADRIAWEELEVPLDETKGGRWFEVLAGARRRITSRVSSTSCRTTARASTARRSSRSTPSPGAAPAVTCSNAGRTCRSGRSCCCARCCSGWRRTR